jgi:hypothetical protein
LGMIPMVSSISASVFSYVSVIRTLYRISLRGPTYSLSFLYSIIRYISRPSTKTRERPSLLEGMIGISHRTLQNLMWSYI